MPRKSVQKDYEDLLVRIFGLGAVGEDALTSTLLDELLLCFWMHDEDYSIVYTNCVVEEKFGPCHGRRCYEYFMGEKSICSCCLSRSVLNEGLDEKCALCKRNKASWDMNIFHIPIFTEDGKKIVIKSNMHIQDINNLYDRR